MELKKGLKLLVDTAPIIYFIEEHPVYVNEVPIHLAEQQKGLCSTDYFEIKKAGV